MMRIALIHALRHSPAPIGEAFARLWPDAALMNLLDDSLSSDLARDGEITHAMTQRFLTLARYAADAGADAILFTCSAFGPCIDACKAALPGIPVLKPNEAMIEEAAAFGSRVGLLATFGPTLVSMPSEFPPQTMLRLKLADGALDALNDGARDKHDQIVAAASADLSDCDVICLAQFSLAPAADLVRTLTKQPVLTTTDSAVLRLRQLLTSRRPDRASK